jgi:hypothetical protein
MGYYFLERFRMEVSNLSKKNKKNRKPTGTDNNAETNGHEEK